MAQLKALYPEVELPKRDNYDLHELAARNTVSQLAHSPHLLHMQYCEFC